jgi:hypothetical protein
MARKVDRPLRSESAGTESDGGGHLGHAANGALVARQVPT